MSPTRPAATPTPAAPMTPTNVAQAFWRMGTHFKDLLASELTPTSDGVERWDVHDLPAYEVVTFEAVPNNLISASWLSVNEHTRQHEMNEIIMTADAFERLFAEDMTAQDAVDATGLSAEQQAKAKYRDFVVALAEDRPQVVECTYDFMFHGRGFWMQAPSKQRLLNAIEEDTRGPRDVWVFGIEHAASML